MATGVFLVLGLFGAAAHAQSGMPFDYDLTPKIITDSGKLKATAEDIILKTEEGDVSAKSLVGIHDAITDEISNTVSSTKSSIDASIEAAIRLSESTAVEQSSQLSLAVGMIDSTIDSNVQTLSQAIATSASRVDRLSESTGSLVGQVRSIEESCTPGTEYESTANGVTTCEPVSSCSLGQYVAADPTATSDRLCLTLNSTVLRDSCPNTTFYYRGACEPIPHSGCADNTADQAVSPTMVGCRKACSRSVNVQQSGAGTVKWNRFWETACGRGWHMCFGQEAVAENDDCVGTWNANYGIYSYSRGTYWGECGSGRQTAFTSTVRGKSCRNDVSHTGMSPGSHDFFDGIYGGFIAGRTDFHGNANWLIHTSGVGQHTSEQFPYRGWPHISLCRTVGWGAEGFRVRSQYPSTCSNDYCNTCASGYFAQQQGTLCCKD